MKVKGREKHSSSADQICAPIAMEKGKKTDEGGQESPNLKEAGHESPRSRVSSQAIAEHLNDKEITSVALDSTASKSSSKDDKNETALTGSENVGGEEEEEEEGDCSRFKGTLYLKNGRWGAHIYKDGERIWLGTFKDREESAKACCRANLKFKGQLGHLNFSEDEKQFQDSLTPDEVVYLIKNHIYDTKLQKWCSPPHSPKKVVSGNAREMDKSEFPREAMIGRQHLFEKKMSVSDVNHSGRLVIPKQHADRYFPKERLTVESKTFLTFVDTSDNSEWQFKFSYWKSCQSYVFTEGWRRFVKNRDLKGGDVVSFSRDGERSNNKFYITVHYSECLMGNNCVQDQSGCDELLQERRSNTTSGSKAVSIETICEAKEMVKSDGKGRVDENRDREIRIDFHGSPQLGKRKVVEDESENMPDDVIKLFGVEISRRGKMLKPGGVEIDPKQKGQLELQVHPKETNRNMMKLKLNVKQESQMGFEIFPEPELA